MFWRAVATTSSPTPAALLIVGFIAFVIERFREAR
jgi:hypothetical protein